jgi:Mg2+/citrate symporter
LNFDLVPFPAALILPDHRRRQREELMRTQYTAALSVIAGLALGAATIEVLHAQAKPMAYVIVFDSVNDQEKYLNEFGPAITKSLQDAGGKYLVRGGKSIPVNGAAPGR